LGEDRVSRRMSTTRSAGKREQTFPADKPLLLKLVGWGGVRMQVPPFEKTWRGDAAISPP